MTATVTRSWQDTPVLVVGASKTGLSAARWLVAQGARPWLLEQHKHEDALSDADQALITQLREAGARVTFGEPDADWWAYAQDLVISPGVPPHAPLMQQVMQHRKTLWTDIDLAFDAMAGRDDVRWVCVTGTNGKTTTVHLIHWLLSNSGCSVRLGGNVGTPVLDTLLDEVPEGTIMVLELSSYQLYYASRLRPWVAVHTNFQPDHLDWHGSLEAYLAAKRRLFEHPVAPPPLVVLPARDPLTAQVALSPESQVCLTSLMALSGWYQLESTPVAWISQTGAADVHEQSLVLQPIADSDGPWRYGANLPVDRYPMKGEHNLRNLMQAWAVALAAGCPVEALEEAVATFPGVPHRLEWLGRVENIDWYNDSKATNPEASQAALEALAGEVSANHRLVLLAGGKDKGTPLEAWAADVARVANGGVILYGEAQARLAEALGAVMAPALVRCVPTLEDACGEAWRTLHGQGGVVLLSPACASFDQFQHFEHRGEVFRQWVATQRQGVAYSVVEGAQA